MYEIRVMTPAEATLAAGWAAEEGWNPGASDMDCFRTVDPDGFLVGVLDGEPAASISVVNYNDGFAFLGFYIVRPPLRGRGYGLALWKAGMAHAGDRVVGLDGVPAQQDNYRKSGFVLAHRNIRYGGPASLSGVLPSGVVPLEQVPFDQVAALDRSVFPAARDIFMCAWTTAPAHVARGLVRGGRLAGFGVIRPCREGFKVGPLVATGRGDAEILLDALIQDSGARQIFLDVPEPNRPAVALAEARGLSPAFETARMYARGVPDIALDRIFGITSFELG